MAHFRRTIDFDGFAAFTRVPFTRDSSAPDAAAVAGGALRAGNFAANTVIVLNQGGAASIDVSFDGGTTVHATLAPAGTQTWSDKETRDVWVRNAGAAIGAPQNVRIDAWA